MPTTHNLLTDAAIRAAKPREKLYRLSDGKSLYLEIPSVGSPGSSPGWRLRFRWRGREQMLSLGVYPVISLKTARARRDQALQQLAHGIRPTNTWRAGPVDASRTFQSVADQWLAVRAKDVQAGQLTAATVDRDRRQLARWVMPGLGRCDISEIKTGDLIKTLKKIEAKGKLDTAHRARETCERIFKYARRLGLTTDNPADAELFEGVLAARATQSYAAITDPVKVGELLRALDGFEGQPATQAALRMAPYVFVRPGELRAAEWAEIDLDAAEWRIPAARMKMRDPHIVPLARQVVKILRELHGATGSGKFVFPAIGPGERCLSENTLNGALRRLGYSAEEHTPHGFRSTASTLLNEMGLAPDLIELQLAHRERHTVRAVYNRALQLEARRKMMQRYANHLDTLRERKPAGKKS